jgi:hypothetical protein
MDNCCHPDSFVAAGADNQLHDGRVYSYPAGHCRHRVSGPDYSGTKNIVAIWTFTGASELLVKEY